jgi:hypothetical protein
MLDRMKLVSLATTLCVPVELEDWAAGLVSDQNP